MGGVFMELPKNITQIGEADKLCKIYAEDYVISYLKQLNKLARDKDIGVALYGIRKEEDGVTYLFIYGAAKLNFLQRESRHLSQAVQQEAEKQRKRYFSDYGFLGYRMLNGEMIEGFHICEQGVCRYISGYAQFYEKNDGMLAYMLDERQESAVPEQVEQEKYDMVKKRQEERRIQSEKEKRQKRKYDTNVKNRKTTGSLRKMQFTAAAVFVVLCIAGVMNMGEENGLNELRMAAGRIMDEISEKQLPDAVEVTNMSPGAGTIVAEDRLTEAIQKENMASTPEPAVEPSHMAAQQSTSEPSAAATPQPSAEPSSTATPQPTPEPSASATPQPTPEPSASATPQPTPEPVSYTIKRGDTLIGICIRRYGSDARVSEICSLNEIGDPDDIKVGQKILLP